MLAFLTSLGTVEDRLDSCLQHMFVPVFHGAISTLLGWCSVTLITLQFINPLFAGIVMLVFSEFDFVIKYFFVVMTTLVILAVFNGLCLLPVLLTLIGPEPEVRMRICVLITSFFSHCAQKAIFSLLHWMAPADYRLHLH